MPSKAVYDAVAARLGSTFTASDGTVLPVYDGNTVGEPPSDGSPFVQIQYPVGEAEQITIGTPGSNRFREEGAIRVMVGIQRGQGTRQGIGWCDDLGALFRGKQFGGGVNTWAPTVPVLDDTNDQGNYWTLAFVVPYYFDLLA